MQCPGNLDEKCGNSTWMSVYTHGAGHFEFRPTQHGACGYAVVNGSISVGLNHYRHCLTQNRTSACYQNTSQETNCNEAVCVSSGKDRQSWIQAYHNCRLVKLDNSTIEHLEKSQSNNRIWIGLAYKVSRKWINGNNAYGYEDYYPFLNSPIQMCLALKTNRTRKLYWLPCSLHLASICEGGDASVPSTEGQSDVDGHTDGWNGVVIGLSVGNAILLLIVIALVLLLQRQRKLGLGTKEIYQQSSIKTSTENATCSPDVPKENGDYTYINPEILDGKPFTHPALTATVNPTSHIENICNSVTDVEKETAPKQHTGMPAGAPHMHLHYYNTAEGVQPRGGDEGAVSLGPDASAAVTGVASSEGVQYFVLENHSSMQKCKGDAGLYDHMERAKGLYDTTQQGGNVRQEAESYSHICAIHKEIEEGDYHVAHAGIVVKSLDDTYNHTFETNS
ncbi:uncharacterized protein LOC124289686 isoform X1 [Haliotis rubra]|uniref:uncharacterized protein LOC124289686 isoform X1 n=1 Tax=Haliotis rubra TaxID=36100 RepID=UPI001EE5AD8C|nr:uncharacterized protein LOC124289686 isoform X1 [Haliotis rubra]